MYFFRNILTLTGALIISCFIFPLGTPYAVGHAIVLSFKTKRWEWFKLIIRFIDGIFYALGYLLFHTAKFLDILWNTMAGEMFEDIVTTREDTLFGVRGITISESVGKEEVSGFLVETGKKFTKGLNKIFGQSQHAADAYHLGLLRKELESKYYN